LRVPPPAHSDSEPGEARTRSDDSRQVPGADPRRQETPATAGGGYGGQGGRGAGAPRARGPSPREWSLAGRPIRWRFVPSGARQAVSGRGRLPLATRTACPG
jgi:hypothetical protein